VRVFEIGRVFRRDASVVDGDTTVAGVHQPMRLAGLAYGAADDLQWGAKERPVDFFDAKGDVEALFAPRRPTFVPAAHPALHPGRGARIEVDGVAVGWVGELHPRWRQSYDLPHAPMVFEIELAALTVREVPRAQPVPRQQAVARDLALVVSDGVTHDALMAAIGIGRGLVRTARLFDLYKPSAPVAGIGAHERSLAVRLELLDESATLTDERIDAEVARVLERLGQAVGARLRA
jgi:phenylalanyl-tRNA synthetase beta chain